MCFQGSIQEISLFSQEDLMDHFMKLHQQLNSGTFASQELIWVSVPIVPANKKDAPKKTSLSAIHFKRVLSSFRRGSWFFKTWQLVVLDLDRNLPDNAGRLAVWLCCRTGPRAVFVGRSGQLLYPIVLTHWSRDDSAKNTVCLEFRALSFCHCTGDKSDA